MDDNRTQLDSLLPGSLSAGMIVNGRAADGGTDAPQPADSGSQGENTGSQPADPGSQEANPGSQPSAPSASPVSASGPVIAKGSGVPGWIKGLLDLVMVLVLALLYNKHLLGGMAFHEIAGLALGGVFIVHAAFNARWIGAMTRRLFSRETPFRLKLCYVLDALLALMFLFIIVSGLFINRTLLPGLRLEGHLWQVLHKIVSYWAVAFAGLHVGLHWTWVMGLFRKVFRLRVEPTPVRIWTARLLAVAVFGWGIFAAVTEQYAQKLFLAAGAFSEARGMSGEDFGLPDGGGFTKDGRMPEGGQFPADGMTPPDGQFDEDDSMPAEGMTPPDGQFGGDGNGKGFRGGRGTPPNGSSADGMRPFGMERGGMDAGLHGDVGSTAAALPKALAIWLGILSVFAVPTHCLTALLCSRRTRTAGRSIPLRQA